MTQCIICGGTADKGWETCSPCDHKHSQGSQEEPNCVPCYQCGQPMYEESEIQELNICDNCLNRETQSQNQYLSKDMNA